VRTEEASVPKFKVLRRVDAYVDYVAEVEADDAREASLLARSDENSYRWKGVGTHQFDARLFVSLDDKGNEIEGAQEGDF
jgi:hypothetical protein